MVNLCITDAILLNTFKVSVALWVAIVTTAALVYLSLSPKSKGKLGFWVGTQFLRLSMFLRKEALFTIDYNGGFMLHFEVSKDELCKELHASKHLEPIPMKIMQADHDAINDKYLVSLYCANLGSISTGTPTDTAKDGKVGARTDVFTYVRDKDGEVALVFLSALVNYPKDNNGLKVCVEYLMHFFGMCSREYCEGYPHLETDCINISTDSFRMEHRGAVIEVAGEMAVLERDLKLHTDFVNANSQIYRGAHGTRNVNFFNKDFIDASVTSWNPTKCTVKNPEAIHPLCRKLSAIQSYGGDDSPIRWYFENC